MSLSEEWASKGFFIVDGLVNESLIDDLLSTYETSVKHYGGELLRQNGRIESHSFSEIGGLTNTLLDPHSYASERFPELADFAAKLQAIYAGEDLQEHFSEATGINAPFVLAQSMFFDQVTTRAHQDCIYLDTLPSGNLVAIWVALQDLNEQHTRFYVYPGSHVEHLPSQKDDETYFNELQKVIDSGRYTLESPMMKKGDVLFWHSRLIHGSRHGSIPNSRRLSVTGHYIPMGYTYGNDSGPIKNKELKRDNGLFYFINSFNV